MKLLILIFLGWSLIFFDYNAYGQVTLVAEGTPLNLPCLGGNVDFTANGTSSTAVFGEDFNIGAFNPGWSGTVSADFSNPCGPSFDGTKYLWMGGLSAPPRSIVTPDVNVACGGTVCFDFKYTVELGDGAAFEAQGDVSPCEGADRVDEGMILQYSVDAGVTFTDFAYFLPEGLIIPTHPGTNATRTFGETAFTEWDNYCIDIPPGAFSATTVFRMMQLNVTGPIYDAWGIDNFYVYADICNPYYYDWHHIPGFPDSKDVKTVVTESGDYTVCWTNGVDADSLCETVSIVVDAIEIDNVAITPEACIGDNTASVSVTVSGGVAPYTYDLTGPTAAANATGNFTDLAPGIYTITVSDGGTCIADEIFEILEGMPCCSVTAVPTDVLCVGGSSGAATATPGSEGLPPFTYIWSNAVPAPIGITTASAGGLAAGDYSVEMTDARGCVANANVAVGEPALIAAGTTIDQVTCNALCNASITVTGASGGSPGYTYSINGGIFQAANVFANLCPGMYIVTVRDDNDCELEIPGLEVTEPLPIDLIVLNVMNETCGSGNGSISVEGSGGTAAYEYTLGGTTNMTGVFPNLIAGMYTINLEDSEGCSADIDVEVEDESGLVAAIDVLNNVTCNGGVNGNVTISANGGTAPYMFSLDGGTPQPSNTFGLVLAGAHTVTVTDANGCIGPVDFVITEPDVLNSVAVVTNARCNGSCDGEVEITAAGATAPYTYSDDAGATFGISNILNGLCSGPVNIVVKDANGCLVNSQEIIAEPAIVGSVVNHVEPSCFGLADGEININGVGGLAPYTFSIDGGTTFSGVTPIIGIAAGNYNLIVKDANDCESLVNEIVNQPPPFTFTYIRNDPSNCGANDGLFEITATLGAAPYDYSIDGGANWQGNGLFQNLFAGLYTLVVEDNNGCVDSVYEALSDTEMISETVFVNDASCFNDCDGSLGVNQTGGMAPYSYTLTPGSGFASAVPNFFGLCAGNYFVSITDAGLCIAFEQIEVGQPDSITFTPTGIDVTCYGGSDGEISFTNVAGGDGGPYMHSIDGGPFLAQTNFVGLTAGIHDLLTRDGNNCLGATTIVLSEPDPIQAIINETDLTCNGNNTGVIQIVPEGGTPAYEYIVSGVINMTGIYANLAAGVYPIRITDAVGCFKDTTANVIEPLVLNANYAISNASCNGFCDGEIDITALGGTPPYLYSADGGIISSGSNILTGLCAGNQDVYIRDNNMCELQSVQVINEPTPLTMTLTNVPATCNLNNAELNITGAGGTPNYMYSNDAGTSFQMGNNFNGLEAINYFLRLEDDNNCRLDSTIRLTAENLPRIDNVITTDLLCNASMDGEIEIISSGGVGVHEYSIGGAFQGGNVFNGLAAGPYTVRVRDASGCISSQNVEITEPLLLTYAATLTNLRCNKDNTGGIELVVQGGSAPYKYSIDNGTTFAGTGTFTFISADAYNILIEDFNDCIVAGIENITEPAVFDWNTFVSTNSTCFNECDGTVTTSIMGGTAPYNYIWSGGIEDPNDETAASAICAGIYSVTVRDAMGCSIDSLDFVITKPIEVPITGVVTTDLNCIGDNSGSITINAPTAVSYNLPGTANTTGDLNGIYTGLPAGNYDIEVIDGNGCRALTNTTLYEPSPLVLKPISDWLVCVGDTVLVQTSINGGTKPYTYNWTNNLDATVQAIDKFKVEIVNNVTYSVTVTDANNCVIGPVGNNINILPPLQVLAEAVPNAMICLGDSVDLESTPSGGQLIDFGAYSDYRYEWNTGVLGDTLQRISVSPSVPSDYTVTITDACGAEAEALVSIEILPDPTLDIIGGGNGCAPELVTFENMSYIPGSTCIWDFGDGTTSTSCGTVDHVFNDAGCYDVNLSVTSAEGCTSSELFNDLVCIYDRPEAGFYWKPSNPTILKPDIQVTSLSYNAEIHEYDFGTATSNEENPSHTFPDFNEETDVEVCQLVISPEACRDSICQIVTIYEEVLFYVPNVFTPDGDEFNQIFKPIFTAGVDPSKYHLTIFNRWGEILFESYNYDTGWTGDYGGNGLVQDGVYIWQIEFGEKISDKRRLYRGHVTILR